VPHSQEFPEKVDDGSMRVMCYVIYALCNGILLCLFVYAMLA
jgi:hypothetical protein